MQYSHGQWRHGLESDTLFNCDTILRGSKWIWIVVLLLPIAARAEPRLFVPSFFEPDSIVWRDSLIPAMVPIDHRPVRFEAGVAGGKSWFSKSWFTNADLPSSLQLAGCEFFNRGSGRYAEGELSLELPLGGDFGRFAFVPGIAFSSTAPGFEYRRRIIGRAPNSLGLDTAIILDSINASMSFIEPRIMLTYDISRSFALRGGIAILRWPLVSTYRKSQYDSQPGGFFSANGSADSVISEGPLPNRNVLTSTAMLGASYEVPISKTSNAQLFLQASADLVGPTTFWNGLNIEGGIRLAFDLTPRREWLPSFIKTRVREIIPTKIDTPVLVQTTVPHDTVEPIVASIEAFSVGPDGKEAKVVRMSIEEIRSRNAVPLLNYIFFDEASSNIAARYAQFNSPEDATTNFKGSSERENVKLLDLYHDCLNILGDRLRTYKSAKLNLVGYTSNAGGEAGKPQLARDRAERIKEYLVRVWKVDPARIRCEGHLLPTKPSPSSTPEGVAENRRVEFVVQDERIVDPVSIVNSEHLATPDKIRLRPRISAPAGVKTSSASITASGKPLIQIKGGPQGFANDMTWAPTEETLAGMKDSLGLELHVVDSSDNRKDVYGSVPLEVRHTRTDKTERLERFSLILFGFDESNVEGRNEKMLAGLARKLRELKPVSISIVGYTDETGDPQHNIRLSSDRANQVLKGLEAAARKEGIALPKNVVVEGHGSQNLLYNNKLPEGRFYSRTVTITLVKEAK